MKTIPISFDSDISGEIVEYVDSSAIKIGEYPLGILVGAIGKILSESDADFNDTIVTLKTVAPIADNPCPYPALVVCGNEIEIIIAPNWDRKEPILELKYPVGSTIYENDSLAKVLDVDKYPDKILLSCEIVSGSHVGARFVIDQDDVKLGARV